MRVGLGRLKLEELFKHHDWKSEEEKENELQEMVDYIEQLEKENSEDVIDKEGYQKRI